MLETNYGFFSDIFLEMSKGDIYLPTLLNLQAMFQLQT